MSTCDHPSRSRKTDAPLYDESSLKYLESQLSPESLLAEDPRMSPDFSVKSEDTSDSGKSNNLDWIMSEFMIKSEEPLEVASVAANPTQPEIIAAPSSPEPEPSSLSPPLGFFKEEKEKLSDILTRTKNPVLPSVYIDNSLIVPEPSKQKYHNPAPLLSPEDIDLDYYEAFMDDKDIAETLFHVWKTYYTYILHITYLFCFRWLYYYFFTLLLPTTIKPTTTVSYKLLLLYFLTL